MENADQTGSLAGIRFNRVGKIYHFLTNKVPDLALGDQVIVETSRGWQLGEVVELPARATEAPEGGLKQIERKATPRDLLQRQMWQQREQEVVEIGRERARAMRLNNIKVVAAEFSFDGSRLTVMFSTEAEEKIELKGLRSELQKTFAPSQVDLRQIGPRDVAKLLGGMGACGLECRCCTRFLTDFNSISIRMAKEQGISLTPAEITGMCGRLRCCLIYEYDQYVEARARLPKRNKRVITPEGEGKVLDVYPMRQAVLVELVDGNRREFAKEVLEPADELEALQKKAQNPCPGGDCGEGGKKA